MKNKNTNLIISHYAKALFQSLKIKDEEKESVFVFVEDLTVYQKLFTPLVVQFLASPIVSEVQKIEILELLIAGCENERLRSVLSPFLKIILQNKRISYIQDILNVTLQSMDKHLCVMKVAITSYREMSDSWKHTLCSLLEKTFHAHVQATSIDQQENLLGGFVIDIEPYKIRLDGSLSTQLEKIKTVLKEI